MGEANDPSVEVPGGMDWVSMYHALGRATSLKWTSHESDYGDHLNGTSPEVHSQDQYENRPQRVGWDWPFDADQIRPGSLEFSG